MSATDSLVGAQLTTAGTHAENTESRLDRSTNAPRHARLQVVGVLNVTPDSFSDGGRCLTRDAAVRHGIFLAATGADIVDVGGESTRPGAQRISEEEELRRVLPVVETLARTGVPVSVDTTRARVARAAVECGASIVNDVSGGQADGAMAPTIGELGCRWILMHGRGPSVDMDRRAHYRDVSREVRDELAQRVEAAVSAGVEPTRLMVDPGLGFAKTAEHNWRLLAELDVLTDLGLPVMIGASRKSFLGRLLGTSRHPRPVQEREHATTAITTHAALRDIWGVRVHDARAARDAAETIARMRAAGFPA